MILIHPRNETDYIKMENERGAVVILGFTITYNVLLNPHGIKVTYVYGDLI